jgi:hypothetical protein
MYNCFSWDILLESLEIAVRTGLDINHEISLGMWSSQIQSFKIVVNLSSKKSSRTVIVTFENDVLSVKFISKVKHAQSICLTGGIEGCAKWTICPGWIIAAGRGNWEKAFCNWGTGGGGEEFRIVGVMYAEETGVVMPAQKEGKDGVFSTSMGEWVGIWG